MAKPRKITFFSCDNGDCSLIQLDDVTIVVDIYYRKKAEDEGEDDAIDFGPDLRKAAHGGHINLFVLTHADKDHAGGFERVFYTGDPADWESGGDLLLADEIWCSPFPVSVDLKKLPKDAPSRPLVEEIQRRDALTGDQAEEDGNRLRILEAGEGRTVVPRKITAHVHAPTASEADVESSDDNTSSLIIQWTLKVNGGETKLLMGGDAPTCVWERLYKEYLATDEDDPEAVPEPDLLQFDILLAPHHCSWNSVGTIDEDGPKKYLKSEDALEALGQIQDGGFIVSSSKPIKRDGKNPPHWEAKQEYLKILAGEDGDPKDSEVQERFRCTGEQDDGSRGHVVFRLTKGGPALQESSTRRAPAFISGLGGGGNYG